MKLFTILYLIYSAGICVLSAADISAKEELTKAFFCAICEPVDAGDDKEIFEKKYPQLEFFHLRPIKIYWGSLKKAQPSLMMHPAPKGRDKLRVLVVLRNENNFLPVDVKTYIKIQNDARSPSNYLLDGNEPIKEADLKQFLDDYSKKMVAIYPLD